MAATIWQLIDREATLARLANDQELFDELVGYFLEDYEPLLRALADAVAKRDAMALERAAHSLKGLAANLGATGAAAAAATLETMGRKQDATEAAAAEQMLKFEMNQLVAALHAYRTDPAR